MRRAFLFLAVLALSGCGRDGAEDGERKLTSVAGPAEPATPPAPQPVRPAPATLAGEWRVAGIDGKDFNESYGLALSADDNEVWWEPRCAGIGRGYTIEGNRIRFGWAPSRGAEPKPGPENAPAVCTIGLPERLADVVRALDAAKTIERTASNGIEISGGGHSVLLFSQ